MVTITEVRKSNATIGAKRPFVAVFTGGTSGIGEATLKALATQHPSATVYLVGRNEARASRIVGECKGLCPGGSFNFLKADLTLLANVDQLCAELAKHIASLDLLFMSQGYLTLEGRRETVEGIDALLSLRYYSRMRLVDKLRPLLLCADTPRIVSIFAAGHENRFFQDDLSLRTHYGIFNSISQVSVMTAFFFEQFVAQYPSISCLHVYPGLVKTAEFENSSFPGWLKWLFKWVILPLLTPWCISVEECGERNLFHATSERYMALSGAFQPERVNGSSTAPVEAKPAIGINGQVGSGVYAVNSDGEVIRSCEKKYHNWRNKNYGIAIWEHTMKAFEAAERKEIFRG